jgi:hypothetical protein
MCSQEEGNPLLNPEDEPRGEGFASLHPSLALLQLVVRMVEEQAELAELVGYFWVLSLLLHLFSSHLGKVNRRTLHLWWV